MTITGTSVTAGLATCPQPGNHCGNNFFPQPEKKTYDMSQQELTSYRLSSLQEPTDDMLHAIMEQVAESARRSTAKFQAELHRRFEMIRTSSK